jgi:hypothetical protein
VIRRLLALTTLLLTLNVSAAEALRVCASQSSHEAKQATEHKDCDKPESPPTQAPTACCDALSSCGPSISIDSVDDEGGVTPDRGTMTACGTRAPATLEQTPEPPPPKG